MTDCDYDSAIREMSLFNRMGTRAEDFGRSMKLLSIILWTYQNIQINFYRVQNYFV